MKIIETIKKRWSLWRCIRELLRESRDVLCKLHIEPSTDLEVLEVILKIAVANLTALHEAREGERQAQLARERAWGVCLN